MDKPREISRASFSLDGTFRLMLHTQERGITEFRCEDFKGTRLRHLVNPEITWERFIASCIQEVIRGE